MAVAVAELVGVLVAVAVTLGVGVALDVALGVGVDVGVMLGVDVEVGEGNAEGTKRCATSTTSKAPPLDAEGAPTNSRPPWSDDRTSALKPAPHGPPYTPAPGIHARLAPKVAGDWRLGATSAASSRENPRTAPLAPRNTMATPPAFAQHPVTPMTASAVPSPFWSPTPASPTWPLSIAANWAGRSKA